MDTLKRTETILSILQIKSDIVTDRMKQELECLDIAQIIFDHFRKVCGDLPSGVEKKYGMCFYYNPIAAFKHTVVIRHFVFSKTKVWLWWNNDRYRRYIFKVFERMTKLHVVKVKKNHAIVLTSNAPSIIPNYEFDTFLDHWVYHTVYIPADKQDEEMFIKQTFATMRQIINPLNFILEYDGKNFYSYYNSMSLTSWDTQFVEAAIRHCFKLKVDCTTNGIVTISSLY
jgi:hypothetical protein